MQVPDYTGTRIVPSDNDQKDIASAFAHPAERAACVSAGPLPDRILLTDHVVEADIGAFQQERDALQRLRFGVVVELAAHEGAASDDVDKILSYDRLTEAIAAELRAERLNLLETLAERIAARILREPQAERVFLRIEKLDRGPWVLGVEIVRAKAEAAAVAPAPAPRPVIAWFQGAVPDLDARLKRLEKLGAPAVICLAPPDIPRPKALTPVAQLHIDLLGIEQAAWSLASRDARLKVVNTRTEIDWALRQGNMIVWAPAKMIFDTPGAPRDTAEGIGLALWLAEELDALKVVTHGAVAAPAESRVPIVPL
ncbi:MAG TPA: dihydroneopterin aldolase [Paracoccaceae bacterium]|nr:dihydroneopterin aldolase [Paracoccaceae bacterium]